VDLLPFSRTAEDFDPVGEYACVVPICGGLRMIRFECPGCAAEFNTADDKAGKPARCPQCAVEFLIPPAAESAPTLPAGAEDFEIVPDEQVEVLPCPGCGARLAVSSGDANKNVDCPYCAATFEARPVHAPPATILKPPHRLRRENDDAFADGNDDDRPQRDVRRRKRRSADGKPGNVTAVGVMLLVGGIYGLIFTFGVLVGTMFVCCLWPFMYLTAVWSILAIIRGSSILGNNDRQSPPTTLLVLQILAVFNLDFINCILGVVGLILLSDERTRAHFEGRRPED